MKLVIGLGNPGEKYENTRHNLGFMVIDRIAEKKGIRVTRDECFALMGGNKEILLAKPQTFMNNSGEAAACLLKKAKVTAEDLIVIHDDLDLPAGKLRLKNGGSSGGHKGVQSIIDSLGTNAFTRIRVGISGEIKAKDTVNFVLSGFKKDELKLVAESVENAAEAALFLLEGPLETAMNKFN